MAMKWDYVKMTTTPTSVQNMIYTMQGCSNDIFSDDKWYDKS